MSNHISFDEMTKYIFTDGKSADFLTEAGRINLHVMECEECRKQYMDLMEIREKFQELGASNSQEEKRLLHIFKALSLVHSEWSFEQLYEGSRKFHSWAMFGMSRRQGITSKTASDFSHPTIVTIMKSASKSGEAEETTNTIRTSLQDKDGNRVAVGLDHSVSLYLRAADFPVGKQVVLMPDDDEIEPQIMLLEPYDRLLNYVCFEDVAEGDYSLEISE